MNIVELCTGYPPDRTGGAEQVVSCIRDGLVPRGHRVRIVTRYWGTRVPGPDITQIRTPKSEFRGYAGWTVQAVRTVSHIRPDLIHCHGLEGALVCIFTSNKRFPRMMHLHNSLSRERGYLKSITHIIGLCVLMLAIMRADLVVVPTQVVREDVFRHLGRTNRNKIIVLPNPVAQSESIPTEEFSRLKRELNANHRKVILYFGKVKRTKGLEDICKAYEMMQRKNEARLVVAGAPTATDTFLQQLKREYEDVVFTGFVPDPAPFYQVADLFCIYTTGFEGGETFGVALVDAMLNKVPIVCSDNPIFREVTGGNAMFAPPQNPGALASAFDKALSDLRPLALRAERAYEFATREYTQEIVSERLEKIYRRLIASRESFSADSPGASK